MARVWSSPISRTSCMRTPATCLSPTLKTNESDKRKKKKGGDKGSYYQKCNLLEQHTSHLYIYIKENQ